MRALERLAALSRPHLGSSQRQGWRPQREQQRNARLCAADGAVRGANRVAVVRVRCSPSHFLGRLNNIPKDLIDRNIKKASDKSQADYMEVTYEAYGLGGVGIVLDILTDNSNRASASVRAAVTKAGGKMADPGSVLFNFKRCGCVVLLGGDEDAVFTAATEAGADDIQPRGGGEPGWLVLTKVPSYGLVFAALKEAGLPLVLDECGLRLLPLVKVDVPDDELFERNAALCDALLELDDVDAVVSNQNEEEE